MKSAGELQTLTEAAYSLDRIHEYRTAIDRDGAFIQGSRGLVAHPATRLEQQHRALFLQAIRQLGISQPEE